MRLLSAVAFALVTGSASAADSPAKGGEPFCVKKDELQEFILALVKKDVKWAQEMKTCIILKSGLKVVTIEDYESDSDIGHVAKVRVFIPNAKSGSLVGYTLKIKD